MKQYFLNQGNLTITLIIISALTIFTFSSCSRSNNDDPVTNDNYYVKYVLQGNGTYGYISDWTVTTPQGLYINSGIQVRSWTQTYGPLNKGFKCEVKIVNGNPSIEIYVSKNQEPFALKVTKMGKSASYTIDF